MKVIYNKVQMERKNALKIKALNVVRKYPMTIHDIADELGISWQSVRIYMVELEKEGLVEYHLEKLGPGKRLKMFTGIGELEEESDCNDFIVKDPKNPHATTYHLLKRLDGTRPTELKKIDHGICSGMGAME